MIDPCLSNKNVLLTGGNNPLGIGAATARALAAQGASVFVHYFRGAQQPAPPEAQAPGIALYEALQGNTAEQLIAELRASGVRAEACEADLADARAAAEVFDQAERALGPIDILVNNAAIDEEDTFLPSGGEANRPGWDRPAPRPITADSCDRHFAVNARAPVLLMVEFGRRYFARGGNWGRIINVSTDGASGFPAEVSYGASKHALESYTRAAAWEMGPLGITVNAVSLGPVQTGWITPELQAWVVPQIALRRIGAPADVADAIVFLASEQARWITGQLLYVGGGHMMPL